MRLAGTRYQTLSARRIHLPETRKTDGEVASRDVVLDVACLGAEDGICCHHAQLWKHDRRHPPLVAIRDHREAISCDGAHGVARDRQQLRVRGGVSHVLNDLRHRELQTVVRGDVGPEHEDQEIDLPITDNSPQYTPVKSLLFLPALRPNATCCNLAKLKVADLVRREPTVGVLWCVHEEPEACHTSRDRGDAFQDEDLTMSAVFSNIENADEITHRQPSYPPTPSMFAIPNANKPEKAPAIALAVKKIAMRVWLSPGRYHFEMSKMAPGKKPALSNRVSMNQPIDPFRSRNSLEQSEQHTNTTQLRKVPHKAMAGHYDAPSRDDRAHEYGRSIEQVEDRIAGYLCKLRQLRDTWTCSIHGSTYQPRCKG